MFVTEAQWVLGQVKNLKQDVYPILNIGSSTLTGRKRKKPSIQEILFDPLEKNGEVIHTDIQSGEGIDISGDLNDNEVIEQLKSKKPKLILCNNLLEHVEMPNQICESINAVATLGSYILVSVPYRYPYHYDPIDTMFRPTPEEIHKMFPNTKIIDKEIVSCTRTYYDKLKGSKTLLRSVILRTFLPPVYKPKMWWYTVSYLPNLFKKFQVSCVLLKKES